MKIWWIISRFLFSKGCLLGVFPMGFSETSLNCLNFYWINPLVLQKIELFMKLSLKADSYSLGRTQVTI